MGRSLDKITIKEANKLIKKKKAFFHDYLFIKNFLLFYDGQLYRKDIKTKKYVKTTHNSL